MHTQKKLLVVLWVWCLVLSFANGVFAQSSEDQSLVVTMTIDGPISPILSEYLGRTIELAEERQAELIIIELNTPGGSIDVMNKMVQQIRSSRVPVIVYVSPKGAMAGSAGTIITLAGHFAVMAPETTIGAASPVGSQGEDIGDAMESKMKEMLKASVRAIAKNRSPEAIKMAEETIESAKALSVDEALTLGLVDMQASSIEDLLKQVDGIEINIDEEVIVLNTYNAKVLEIEKTFIEELLNLMTNPNVVFLLLAIGVQAVLIELSNPGGWVAGFIGVVCLLLATYGIGVLPVNWFGILFFLLAFVLFVLDIKAPTHGALTIAGTFSFVVGALILFNSSRLPGFPPVSIPLVIGTGIVIAASFFVIISFAVRAQKAPVITGVESLPGQTGFVRHKIDPYGQVQVGGELWSAEATDPSNALEVGTMIQVRSVSGVRLVVEKFTNKKEE